MDAGRELDRRVGEQIFKYWMYHYDKDVAANCYYCLMDEHLSPVASFTGLRTGERKTEAEAWEDMPHFSTDIAAAWQVVEKMNAADPEVFARFAEGLYEDDGRMRFCLLLDRSSTDAAYLICLAALRAIGAL